MNLETGKCTKIKDAARAARPAATTCSTKSNSDNFAMFLEKLLIFLQKKNSLAE
jgi:hypothetical protein